VNFNRVVAMIQYQEQSWRALFSWRGSVIQHAAKWSVPYAIIAVVGGISIRQFPEWRTWLADMDLSDMLKDFSFILGFLVVFRSRYAYARWWEGGTLLQQLRGEWFNAFSSLLAFCNNNPKMQADVELFQRKLAAMISLLFANALEQVSTMEDNSFQLIGIEGFDVSVLDFLNKSHDSCEVVLQWVQRLIVEANTQDIIKIAPPILARVYNQLANGLVKLNNARKIKQFPIPFPLAQMVVFMMVLHTNMTALTIALTIESPAFAFLLTFAVVTVFWCIHYFAVEIEQPYGDDPNDLPLHDMMVDMNQSLLAMMPSIARSPPKFDLSMVASDFNSSKRKVDLCAYIFRKAPLATGIRRRKMAVDKEEE